jgi:hypothetical protein
LDQELSLIIDMCWKHFIKFRDMEDSAIVNPSIPVLWFGDLIRYMEGSRKRVVTLAINPSSDEFRLNKKDLFNFIRFKQGKDIWFKDRLEDSDKLIFIDTLNEYFKDEPYKWFKRLETPLNCIDATLGGKLQNGDFSNTAIHIDLCPLATKEKWKDVEGTVKEALKEDARLLLSKLLQYLKPDVILASISEEDIMSIFNLSAKKDYEAEFKNNKGGFIRQYNYKGIKLIVGRSMQGTPFGAMTNDFIKENLEALGV